MQTIHSYDQILCNFLAQEFPGSVSNAEAVFEAVAAEFFGTKQHRYGPMPTAEQQVVIRRILRSYIDSGDPIEVLVPWGSSKQGNHDLDVLELSALRSIHCLAERVKRHYTPGIHVSIRLEDATDMILFDTSANDATFRKINYYAGSMQYLTLGLKYREITLKRETDMMEFERFGETVRMLTPWIAEYLGIIESHGHTIAMESESYRVMRDLGWKGTIPLEQMNYYQKSNKVFYPHMSDEEINFLVGKYFACSLVRRLMGGTGAPAGEHIKLYYGLPVPGIPKALSSSNLFYRTVPERWTNKHKAPWIGRGYIEIQNDNSCKIKIADFDSEMDTTPYCFTVGNAKVQAPYILV